MIDDPSAVARTEARLGEGFGNSFVVPNVLNDLDEPRHRDKRDLVGIIEGLMAHLTPEQELALAAKLPPRIAEAAKGVHAPNGAL